MAEVPRRLLKRSAAGVVALVGAGLVMAAVGAVHAQQRLDLFLFAWDEKGVPVLDLKGPAAADGAKGSEVSVKEAGGEARVLRVDRFGWPVRVTILLDNGAKTRTMLPFVKEGLEKFVAGIPQGAQGIPLTLVTTAPTPRILVRDSKDPAAFKKAIALISPEPEDGAYGRFSDSLAEYARRLDDEFRTVGPEQMTPYLPILIVISTTSEDGSEVKKEDVAKMITSLVKYRVWTNFVMVNPSKTANITDAGSELAVNADEGQIGEIANTTREKTGGRYFALGGSGASSLSSKLLPDLARDVSLRYVKQMMQHRVALERPAGVTGPISLKDFGLAINRPGVQFQFAFDPYIP